MNIKSSLNRPKQIHDSLLHQLLFTIKKSKVCCLHVMHFEYEPGRWSIKESEKKAVSGALLMRSHAGKQLVEEMNWRWDVGSFFCFYNGKTRNTCFSQLIPFFYARCRYSMQMAVSANQANDQFAALFRRRCSLHQLFVDSFIRCV